MALNNLPTELLLLIVKHLNTLNTSRLALTSKTLCAVAQRELFREVDLDRIMSKGKFWPLAYVVFTYPHLARQIETLHLPQIPLAGKNRDQGWLNPTDVEHKSIVKAQVSVTLKKCGTKDFEDWLSRASDEGWEDLALLLILRNAINLGTMTMRPLGTRTHEHLTRRLMRAIAPSLKRLSYVRFGIPSHRSSPLGDQPMKSIECSWAIFAELFRLPALETLDVFAIGPRDTNHIDDWDHVFEFINEIEINTSIKSIRASEQLAAPNAHLDRLLQQCQALEAFCFMTPEERYVSTGSRSQSLR